MYIFYRGCVTFALTSLLVITTSTQATDPTPTPTPAPYMSTAGCSVFSEYPTIYQACMPYFSNSNPSFNPPGVLIINPTRGANISEAGQGWLILAEPGVIQTSSTNTLNLQDQQLLVGIAVNDVKPVINYSKSSPQNLIHAEVEQFTVMNLELNGSTTRGTNALLFSQNPLNALIAYNTFNTSGMHERGIKIQDYQVDEENTYVCNPPVILDNTFNLSASQKGIDIRCFEGEESHVLPQHNHFKLSGNSAGIHIIAGGFISYKDTFLQQGAASSDSVVPVGISFSEESQDEHTHPFHNSEVSCALFDGGTYKQLVPIRLTHFVDSDESHHNSVRIAHNIFRNVPYAIETYSNLEKISDDSFCNIWEPTDASVNRCLNLTTGFIHFTDGIHCGVKPENFVEPDCFTLRLQACGTGDPLMPPQPSVSSTVTPFTSSIIPTPSVELQLPREGSSGKSDSNKVGPIAASVLAGATVIGVLTVVAVVVACIAVRRSTPSDKEPFI